MEKRTIKEMSLISMVVLTCLFVWCSQSNSAQRPKPLGLEIGKMTYEEVLDFVRSKEWKFEERSTKGLAIVKQDSPEKGKQTFLYIVPKELEGAKGLFLFFGGESVLEAVMLHFQPRMFEDVMDEVDGKYELVRKRLVEKSAYSPFPHVLWQGGDIYVELQKLSSRQVRLIYVEKVLYENYRGFLQEGRQSFWPTSPKPIWIKEL